MKTATKAVTLGFVTHTAMETLLFSSLCWALLTASTMPSYAQFPNSGFESGTFEGWSKDGGTWSVSRLGDQVFTWSGDPGKSAIVSQGYDPLLLNLGIYRNMVFEGSFAARVNNSDKGSHFSTISREFVSSSDDIYFEWLVVLQEPGHPHNEEPFFRITLTDESDDNKILLDRFYASDTIPAEILHTVYDPGSGTPWKFTDWQQEHIDTRNVKTHTLKLQVMGADCALGGHGGYLYVDRFSTNSVCVRPPPGLRAWWPFDETAGPTADDISYFNNQGAYYGNPTPVAGVVSNGLCFNGTTDFVVVSNHPEINVIGSCTNGAESFTIDAWIRANVNGPDTQTLVDKRVNPASPQGYCVFLYNGILGIQIADGVSWQNYYGTAPDLRDGLWHFIAVTVARCTNNVNAGTFYVDGSEVYAFTDPHTGDLNNSANLYISCRNPAFGANYYSGCMDELEIYKRALTAWELNGIFNARSAGKCKTNCYCASISGYKYNDLNGNGVWDFGEPKLANWTIHLSDGQTAVTDAEGYYNFTDLLDGTYIVTEAAVPGWTQTAPLSGSYTITLSQGQSTNELAFGNRCATNAIISGFKFNDLDGDGIWDTNEPALANWTISVFDGVTNLIASTQTDTNGHYQFSLPCGTGTYLVTESNQPGWCQTSPTGLAYTVILTAGQGASGLNFGNTACCVPPPAGMVGWWPGDGDALDYSVFKNHGTPVKAVGGGTESWAGQYAPGEVDEAFNFSGCNDCYISVPDQPQLNFGVGSLSIDAWIKIPNLPAPPDGMYCIVDKRSLTTEAGYYLYLSGGSPAFDIRAPGYGLLIPLATPVNDDQWHHIAVTVSRPGDPEDSEICFYIDGVQIYCSTGSAPAGSIDNTADLHIGRRIPDLSLEPVSFQGSIDEVEIFNRALTPSEVASIAMAGNHGKCKPICGQKFNDMNGNGVRDAGEPVLPGWTIHLSSGQTAVTDAQGYYQFLDLPVGTYAVTEQPQLCWQQTAPVGGAYTVTLNQTQSLIHLDFGNQPCVRIQCPSNIVTECTSSNGTPVSFTATATNLCGNNGTIVCTPPSPGPFFLGTTAIHCVATDTDTGCSNSCDFTVTVVDTTAPTISCPSNVVVTSCYPTVVPYIVTAFDDCCTNVTVWCTPGTNHLFVLGSTPVYCVATDCFNNIVSCVFTVEVVSPPPYDCWAPPYFGCTNCLAAMPYADPDGDGMSNTNEFLAGFNPTNNAAYLHIISIMRTGSDVLVTYLGANGDNTWSPGIQSRTNVLEYTAGSANGSYSNNFVSTGQTNILSGGTGLGAVTNMVEVGGATNRSRYYRVRVLLP